MAEATGGRRTWGWIRVAAIIGLLGVLVAMQCSKTPEPDPPESAAEAAEGGESSSDAVFLVRARVVVLDSAALTTDEGRRLTTMQDSPFTPEAIATAEADIAALTAGGTARVVSQPSLMMLAQQPASVGVEFSAPGGAGSPRITRTDTLVIECAVAAGGGVLVRGELRAEQKTGVIEHAADEIGLPLSDHAMILIHQTVPDGAVAIGSQTLGSGSDLGGAIVLFLSPTRVESTPAQAEPVEPGASEPGG